MGDLLFELRCEELPPKDVRAAAESLAEALRSALADAGLEPASTSAAWTPRRIAAWAHGLPERTADREERLNGPKLKAAFDAEGRPTKAAEGFARKAGVAPAELQRDAEQVFAIVRTPGRAASQIAAEALPKLPALVKWKKTMRWGGPVAFARPIRGVVALLGGDVVACEVAGLVAGRTTRGHPFLATAGEREVTLDSASREEYLAKLRKAHVLADPAERRDAVLSAARKLARALEVRDALLEEVTNLVEWPTALLGRFDPRYLALPPRLLVTVMEHHQRFFAVRGDDGALAPNFVAILDREEDSVETARRGFERVLVPRLHDATFFFEEDRKQPLAARAPRLADVQYHKKLGTLATKTERLVHVVQAIAAQMGLGSDAQSEARRAAELAKCDLVTLLVGEFPELQGYVGSVYAHLDGEPVGTCEAIAAQYRHDFEMSDMLGGPALALALAENLDVLCAFGTEVGLPSGSADPFGVRRAAINLIDLCETHARTLDLETAIRSAGGTAAILEYVDTRLRYRARGAAPGHRYMDAVVHWRSVGEFYDRLRDLQTLSSQPSFTRLLEVAERCRNITRKADVDSRPIDEALLREPAEKALADAWRSVRRTLPAPPAALGRDDVARAAEAIADPLHRFFADVFVNADDLAVRANRLSLLRDIDATFLRFADLCRVQRA